MPNKTTYPIRILYVISSLANEGPTRVLLNTVRNIDRSRFQPEIITLVPEKASSLMPIFKGLNIEITSLHGEVTPKYSASFLHRSRLLRNILKRGQFQITHAHCPRSLFYVVAATPVTTKSAYTAHIYPSTQFRALYGNFRGTLYSVAAHLAIRKIDYPIACSDSVANEYKEKQNFNLGSVNNGIEPLDSTPLIGQRDTILSKLGLNPQLKYLLFVGRLSPEKRIAEFIETFSRLNTPGIHLVVLGTGPQEERVLRAAGDTTHYFGFHTDIVPFLVACDFYVSPSATEGLANSLLEAMSVGMPSLLSDIPSHRAVVQSCSGDIGQIFDPGSDSDVSSKINAVMAMDSTALRDNIRSNFRRLYHAKTMAQGYEVIYERVNS